MNSKTGLVLIFFILLLLVFVSGMIGDTDLTPATIRIPGENKVAALPNGPVAPQPLVGGIPVTVSGGPCPSVYTVVKGDTLYKISRNCGLTLQNILAANPGIANPNLILVGQKINIYYPGVVVTATAVAGAAITAAPTATAVPATAVPPTAVPTATSGPTQPLPVVTADSGSAGAPKSPTAASLNNKTAQQLTATASAISVPVSLRPGTSFDLVISNLPANTPMRIIIARQPLGPTQMVGEFPTDAKGVLTAAMKIPPEAQPGEKWVVTVSNAKTNTMITSPAILIE